MSGKKSLAEAVSDYGADTKAKLSSPAVTGAPEDQLRSPLETLFKDFAEIAGYPPGSVSLIGEVTLAALSTRPDFAVTRGEALIGHIEVKAPGKGADPRKFSDKHDKTQWTKLRCLPNLLYTDGNAFSLWRNGERQGKLVRLDGDVETSGKGLKAPPDLLALYEDFLSWDPIPPRSAKELAATSARLCRLLRDEVEEELARGRASLEALARDWRDLLFPEAEDKQFADGYAQAVTFGLLMAKSQGLSLAAGIDHAAIELRKVNSLIGSALQLLTDDKDARKALETSLDTLVRVLDVVDWPSLSKGKPDAWLYFYEDFLAVYDNKLRKSTGSYYTPPEVVGAMVRLVDEALRSPSLFGRAMGLADDQVRIADPAVGTGTYLLGVLRRIAKTVEGDMGAGAVPGAIDAAIERLIGFEIQFGPFAVAQLRFIAEILNLTGRATVEGTTIPEPRLFITDTLGDPFQETQFPAMLAPIGKSRQKANKIKREEEITVVIGNPPYKEKAKGRGGWIEEGTKGREAPLARWMPPPAWGVSAHAKHLRNLYVYFWRWATWKVFGSGYGASTGEPDEDRVGIVCFITVAGFLNGPGFQKMREDLRRECSHIWVIDCSPEGHQPEVATRIFQAVQQPVCIVLAARPAGKDSTKPAEVLYRSLALGRREDKFAELANIVLEGTGWDKGFEGWRAPLQAKSAGAWATFPALEDLFIYNGSGVMPGRTWVIAPDQGSLADRWAVLTSEADPARKELLFHPHLRGGKPGDKHINKNAKATLSGIVSSLKTVATDIGPITPPIRHSFRSFDRQWIVPDVRLINQPNPTLWSMHSSQQIYLTSPEDRTPTNGPAASFCGEVPDLHHYHGRGGRAFPLWQNTVGTNPNIKPALLKHLGTVYDAEIAPEDVMAYIAAVAAHPGFTARFVEDLRQPGLRVPITADAKLFAEAVALGREVIWLHCYGERLADLDRGRPSGPPRLPAAERPTIPSGGAIPGAPEPLPEEMDHDAPKNRLLVGKGYVDNVPKAVWEYEVSGKNVLRQWFSYRRRDRSRPLIGDKRPPSPLDSIQPDHWLPEYTKDLIDLLNVLGWVVKLEPKQKDLMDRILAGPLLDRETLDAAGALTGPPRVKGAKKGAASDQPSLI